MSVSDFVSVINQLLPEPHAGLLAGITFGTKAALSKELYDQLVRTGVLHIVALSGMNITILTDLVNKTLLWIVPRRMATALTLLLVIWFVWFVGPSASIVRAAIMGSISLLAIIWGKQYWALWSWLLAVVIMLLLNFSWLTDISFQLSALATLGIILFGKSNKNEVKKLEKTAGNLEEINRTSLKKAQSQRYLGSLFNFIYSLIAEDLRLTLSAQVFTIPLIFFTFHRISLISPLTNILIGWTIVPITIFGWAVSILGWLWLPLGQLAAWFVWMWLQYLLLVVEVTSKVPLASIGF